MGHWTFSAQYLQTALILPKLFIEAKLEWLLQHTQDNQQFDKQAGFDYNRLHSEITRYEEVDPMNGDNTTFSRISSIPDVFNRFDKVINDQKKAIRRVNI